MSSGAAETDNAEKNVADEASDEKVKNEIKMTIEEFLVNRDLNVSCWNSLVSLSQVFTLNLLLCFYPYLSCYSKTLLHCYMISSFLNRVKAHLYFI